MTVPRPLRFALATLASTMAVAATPASAQLVLSEVIVDLAPDKPAREDIEAWNSGKERMYVVAQPSEILNPGTPAERRVDVADPSQGGLLVTPQRMILEPGERRLVRLAWLAARPERDRVYRVTIKPVVGDLSSAATAIKILVGYDVLVIARPAMPKTAIVGERHGRTLDLANTGTTSVEIYGGRQCVAPDKGCTDLPATRLYAGAHWTQTLKGDGPVSYRIKTGTAETVQKY